jgi:predicted RNA-binding protein YlqC (UPF0109 family)
MSIKELLHSMVCSIVDDVENVSIEEETTELGLSFKVAVSKDDVGKLIGTKGRIASAIRTVTKAAGAKQGIRVLVNVDKAPLER